MRHLGVDVSDDEVVASLQEAHIDTLWLGSWSPTGRANLIEACEAVGISVVGPDSSTVRSVGNPDVLRGLPGGDGKIDVGRHTRRVEVDVLADAHGTVWQLDTRVSIRRDGRSLIAEAPCTSIDSDVCERLRVAVADLIGKVGYQGAATVVYLSDGADFVLDEIDCVASNPFMRRPRSARVQASSAGG